MNTADKSTFEVTYDIQPNDGGFWHGRSMMIEAYSEEGARALMRDYLRGMMPNDFVIRAVYAVRKG